MDDYICPNCQAFFDNRRLLADHEKFGCEEDEASDSYARYCCGMIYEHGEDTCFSCGEPL